MNQVRVLRVTALAAALVATVAGCDVGHSSTKPGPEITTTITTGPTTPDPVKTVIRSYRTYAAGQTGVLSSPAQHAALSISVGPPATSTQRLSTTHGFPPEFGNYVTFRLTIVNTGRVPVLIQRLDFFVTTPGAHKTTTDEGDSPESGSDSQLDTTQLTHGQSVTNDLTFDVAHPSGTLFYAPGGHKALAWTFQ